MDELERYAQKEADSQQIMAERDAASIEHKIQYSEAHIALLGGLSCLKASVESGRGVISRLWPVRDDPSEVDEISAKGPWVPYVTNSGPITLRLSGDYRDIKLPNPYVFKSIALEVKTNRSGAIPSYEHIGSIWYTEGAGVGRTDIQLGKKRSDSIVNPLSDEAMEFYGVLKDVAIESV